METDAGTFDALAYKQATREQWQDVAGAWDAWGPTLETWLGPATELMLDSSVRASLSSPQALADRSGYVFRRHA